MTDQQLIDALQSLSVETGSLACLGCGHEHNCSLQGCNILREAIAALREQEERRWIPVTERLPESQKTVLVSAKDKTFGHRHTMMAAHIGHREAKTEDYGWQEYEGDTEYDEENDCFWIPECWWESNFVEDNTNWIIGSDYEITHWMPLPEPLEDGTV